jgi:glucosamine-6-phosphate deaminase
MSNAAAKLIAAQLRRKPDSVLGLATGSTPLGIYRELGRMHREEGLDFAGVRTFNLDEYYGLAPDHPQSYHYFMDENLLRHVNIDPKNVHIPGGLVKDIEASCSEYETSIRSAGGIDIQLLGIGRDGHIAFNEPGSSLGSRTRLKTLAQETISDNARFFKSLGEVPRFAITMGVGTILESHHIVLLASGVEKSEAVRLAVEGPVTSEITASALQLHPSVTVFLDEAAAEKLKRKDYYKYVESMRQEVGQADV